MFSDQNGQEKILKVLIWVLIGLTIFFSLGAPTVNSSYFFLLLFAFSYWQKDRLEKLLVRLTTSISPFFIYLLVAVVWAAILELTLARLAFHPNPIVNFLISLGFYLPYFVIWYVMIAKFKFNFFEVFYLAGFSGVLFGLIITKQILIPFAIHPEMKIALIAFFGRAVATLVIYGCLTSLPLLLLFENRELAKKPFKQYLLAIISTILTLPIFLIWANLANLLLSRV